MGLKIDEMRKVLENHQWAETLDWDWSEDLSELTLFGKHGKLKLTAEETADIVPIFFKTWLQLHDDNVAVNAFIEMLTGKPLSEQFKEENKH